MMSSSLYGGFEFVDAVELDLLELDMLWCDSGAGGIPLIHGSCKVVLEPPKVPQFDDEATGGFGAGGIFFTGMGGGLLL